MKTYVIILSKTFPKSHPLSGQETGFGSSFKSGQKIHTVRGNYPMWKKRFEEVQKGTAVLSVREWTGTPYRSPQRELRKLTSEDLIGVQKVVFTRSQWEDEDEDHFCYWANIDGFEIDFEELAKNDGFSDFTDFVSWIDPSLDSQTPDDDGWVSQEMAIIYFTKFRYER